MDFFAGQEAARRASRRMIVLFALAVLAIVLAVNAALGAIWLGAFARHGAWAQLGFAAFPHWFFETNTAIVLLFICGGTAMQILELREGGDAVARMVGARAIVPGTKDALERRLVNVVEEMAIAAGIPAPRAYILDGEGGINAFAAGNGPADAIVAVTRGTLERLRRDELQGVVGHEFSHILHGDISLNLRLVGVLHGLLLLALFGRFLMNFTDVRPRRDGNYGSMLALAGIAILAIGYIGVFFGRIIKSSVSRQREFLADASSVQFTRNPEGIGGALRKIGGLGAQGEGDVAHLHGESLSHMFLAPVGAAFLDGMFASHPPLEERIARVYGRAMGFLDAPVIATSQAAAPEALPPLDYPGADGAGRAILPAAMSAAMSATAGIAPAPSAAIATAGPGAGAGGAGPQPAAPPAAGAVPSLPQAASLQEAIADTPLRAALDDPGLARLLALGMLLDKGGEARERQLAAVTEACGSDAGERVAQYRALVADLPPGWRLALLDMAMPALRTLDAPARDRLLQLAHVLILADGRVTLAEFLLFTVLKGRLAPQRPGGPRAGRMLQLEDAREESAIVLSLIAEVRLPQDAARAYAPGAALLPGTGPLRTGDALALPKISAAFERLAQLAPLQKPALVKACLATAFVDGASHWKAASCLRSLCAALDCPLPSQVEDVPVRPSNAAITV
jgi:Zn-dependent protease with chaperone function